MAKSSLYSRQGRTREDDVAPGNSRALPADEAAASAALSGQIARYGAAGAANVGVDLSVYAGLLALGAPVPAAKAVAFVCGATFAYFANKNWTFRAGKGSARQFAAFASLYAVSMAVNVGANSAIIAMLGGAMFGKSIAYCSALALSATLNFIGMREILLVRGRAGEQAG